MVQGLSLEILNLIKGHKDTPVPILADMSGLSKEVVYAALCVLGCEPVYASTRLTPDSKPEPKGYTIPQAMERTRLPYEAINDAIRAGELPVQRPETMTDSYLLNPQDVQPLIKKIENGGIKLRRELRSERIRREQNLYFPEKGISPEQRFLNYLFQLPLLTLEEEQALLKQVRLGDESAVDDLIEANFRLVYWKVKANWRNCPSLEPMDLFQEGVLGLQHAILKYNPTPLNPNTSGQTKLSTYATWWINYSITRAIVNQGATIRIPAHVYERRSVIAAWVIEFIKQNGAEPSIQAIISALPKYQSHIRSDVEYMARTSSGYDLNIHNRMIHLDDLLTEDGPYTFHEIIADTKIPLPYVPAMAAEEQKRLTKVLKTLRVSPRDKEMFEMRTGIKDGIPHILEDVGNAFGVTRERVRQVEENIKKRMRDKLQYPSTEQVYRHNMKDQLSRIFKEYPTLESYIPLFFQKYGYADGRGYTNRELVAASNGATPAKIRRKINKIQDLLR
ncbi:MAG TPA: sigma-70 family RNA polymerase sigma factor, partial [Candidatus Nanoarchaeia archaeon]|nr:sigma-70 family RNA polymerase sigma factor [Candidatus Nanoarchaeia archaeon]